MPNHSSLVLLGQVDLGFSDWRPLRHVDDPLHKELSAVARVGDSLFLACDETASVERLRRIGNGRFGENRHFALDWLVDLPAGADGEMDVESLCAVDVTPRRGVTRPKCDSRPQIATMISGGTP